MLDDLPIGRAAALSGVKVPTIRYYEQIGLLRPAPRNEGNRRLYGEDDLSRLGFIRHARQLGFELDQIRELIALSEEPESPCGRADAIARRQLADIDDRVRRLLALRAELARMTEGGCHGTIAECRVIEVLADHGKCAHHAVEDAA